jgi:hypothetical protein
LGCETNLDAVLEAVMAGKPAREIEAIFQRLSRNDRGVLLCTVCSIRNEIASNCPQHADEISTLLASNCPLFMNGLANCLLDLPVSVRFALSNGVRAMK